MSTSKCEICGRQGTAPVDTNEKIILAIHHSDKCSACRAFKDISCCQQCQKEFKERGEIFATMHSIISAPSTTIANITAWEFDKRFYYKLAEMAIANELDAIGSIDINILDEPQLYNLAKNTLELYAEPYNAKEILQKINEWKLSADHYSDIAERLVHRFIWIFQYIIPGMIKNYANFAESTMIQDGMQLKHVHLNAVSSQEYLRIAKQAIRENKYAFEDVQARRLDESEYCELIETALNLEICVWPYVVESKLNEKLRKEYAYMRMLEHD